MDQFRTKALAKLVGCGVQTIRNWEAWGFLPPATRTAKNYRVYTQQHVDAFKVSSQLGFAWLDTERIMRAIHAGQLDTALAFIDDQHAKLHLARVQAQDMLGVLRTLGKSETAVQRFARQTPLTIQAVAAKAGVRASAIRYWEQRGLLHPVREKGNDYRRYDAAQSRRAQVVALLRANELDFESISRVLDELDAGNFDDAIRAAERRLAELSALSLGILRGKAMLWSYLEKYGYTKP
jgi:DNA-binding transcriptional MerR regulator